MYGIVGRFSGEIQTKQAFIYCACVSSSRPLCSVYSQPERPHFNRDFIHERIENKADYDAFLVCGYGPSFFFFLKKMSSQLMMNLHMNLDLTDFIMDDTA